MPTKKASKIPAKEDEETEDHKDAGLYHLFGRPYNYDRGSCRVFEWKTNTACCAVDPAACWAVIFGLKPRPCCLVSHVR